MMPKGVEHNSMTSMGWNVKGVERTMMPKGVEHGRIELGTRILCGWNEQ